MEIEVDGTAVIARPPERATLRLSLGFEDGDKAKALRATTEVVRRVQGAIEGFAAQQPTPTTWSSVQPIVTRSWRPHHQNGKVLPPRHRASALVLIKFRDFRALSDFVGQSGGEPGVRVERVDWALTEATREGLESEVLARAVSTARARAETIARASGASGVEFSRVTDSAHGASLHGGATRRASFEANSSEGVDLSPEDIEVRASVRATFVTTGGDS